jgi:O-antigen/teichoic acid export membrane protein
MVDSYSQDVEMLPPAELQRRAITGSVWTAIHVLVYLPVAFVANAFVARSLGVSDYGHLAFLTVTLGLTLLFANFGFTTASIQRGSRAEAGGRRNEANDLLRRSLGFHLIVEMPIAVAVAIVLTRGDPFWKVVTIGTAVVLTSLFSGATLAIIIQNRTAAAAQLAILANLLLQGASVAAALLSESASAVWVVRTLITALALGLNFMLLDRERRKTALHPRLPRKLGPGFWRFALLSWAASLVALLVFSRSEIFLLQAFNQPEALGIFALAFGLSQQITAPVDSLLLPLLPAIAGILSSWPERALGAFERSTRVSALICGGIAAALVPALVYAIPLIYGRAFESAAWLFVPLALVSIFQSVNNPVTAFVQGRERAGLRLKANAAALLVDVAIALVLIPPFGAWGAVVAAAVGQLIVIIWLAVTEPLARTRGVSGLLGLYQPFLLGMFVASAVLAVGFALQHWSAALTPILTCGMGGGLYVIAVRLSGSGLTSEDRDAFLGAMSAPMRAWAARLLRPITAPPAT